MIFISECLSWPSVKLENICDTLIDANNFPLLVMWSVSTLKHSCQLTKMPKTIRLCLVSVLYEHWATIAVRLIEAASKTKTALNHQMKMVEWAHYLWPKKKKPVEKSVNRIECIPLLLPSIVVVQTSFPILQTCENLIWCLCHFPVESTAPRTSITSAVVWVCLRKYKICLTSS